MNFALPAFAVIGFLIHIYLRRRFMTLERALEIALLWLLPVWTGLSGIYAFLGHTFAADQIAAYIGWPAGSPFQFEVAVANLALGVLGICCIWIRGNFWTATVVAGAVFGWGAACVHIRDITLKHNLSSGNAGPALIFDIAAPLVLIILLTAYEKVKRKRKIIF